MLLGDGGDLADGVHGEVLREGLAAEETQPVHGVPLRQLEQGDGALQEMKYHSYNLKKKRALPHSGCMAALIFFRKLVHCLVFLRSLHCCF